MFSYSERLKELYPVKEHIEKHNELPKNVKLKLRDYGILTIVFDSGYVLFPKDSTIEDIADCINNEISRIEFVIKLEEDEKKRKEKFKTIAVATIDNLFMIGETDELNQYAIRNILISCINEKIM